MKVTIKELMQLKNEVAGAISTKDRLYADRMTQRIEYGVTTINNERVEFPHLTAPFPDHHARTIKLFDLSEKLNDTLAAANEKHRIPSLVRQRQNAYALIRQLEAALEQSKEYTRTESVTIAGGGVQRVQKKYQPYMNSANIKKRVRDLKGVVRDLQTAIDKANTETVTVEGVTRDDIESIIAE